MQIPTIQVMTPEPPSLPPEDKDRPCTVLSSFSSSSQPTLRPPGQCPTHISLPAEGLGQSCMGSMASMISLKRVFPTLTASYSERGMNGQTSPPGHTHPAPATTPSPSQREGIHGIHSGLSQDSISARDDALSWQWKSVLKGNKSWGATSIPPTTAQTTMLGAVNCRWGN